MAVSPANLIDIKNNYSNLQHLLSATNLALIPNGGKLQLVKGAVLIANGGKLQLVKGVVLRALGAEA